jgi:small subunit ribosomal protein S2
MVLFVGTKRQIQDIIENNAKECDMPYVKNRWLGGLLTNFETISKRSRSV